MGKRQTGAEREIIYSLLENVGFFEREGHGEKFQRGYICDFVTLWSN